MKQVIQTKHSAHQRAASNLFGLAALVLLVVGIAMGVLGMWSPSSVCLLASLVFALISVVYAKMSMLSGCGSDSRW